MAIEDDVRAVLENLDEQHDTNPGDEQEEIKQVIHVDKYTLPDGSALYRLPNGEAVLLQGDTSSDIENPLDTNAVESVAPPITETPTVPLSEGEAEEEQAPEPAPTGKRKQGKPSYMLVPLLLLCILAAGTLSYLFLLPLAATATITITPKARSLHIDATFTIAESPKGGQVQGRELASISLTKSETVPATGHASDPATKAAGILTFYNADATAHTIPAGVSFTIQGVTVVTEESVTVQAAVPPSFGTGITPAYVIQAGRAGNIAAHTIYTRCCGSQFITATNTTSFSGGQDARDYTYIQSSDIRNASQDLLSSVTPQATTALNKEARTGEQLVTPLCTPRTTSSQEPGSEGTSVTVSVTQSCMSVVYQTNSLHEVATTLLAHRANTHYQQVGTTQVTVNGSTYTCNTATLHVSLASVWVYSFSHAQLTNLKTLLAGVSTTRAETLLARVSGVQYASIHLERYDFKDLLPANPQHITIQFFYIVS